MISLDLVGLYHRKTLTLDVAYSQFQATFGIVHFWSIQNEWLRNSYSVTYTFRGQEREL